MSSPPPRLRFATLDSSLLARKGEARPAMVASLALDDGAAALAEEASRSVPPDLGQPFALNRPNLPKSPPLFPVVSESLPPPPLTDGVHALPVERLRPSPAQPRQVREGDDLAGLARSIEAHGVVQPLVVRPDASRPGAYEIVAGTRRFRAAKLAGLDAVPVVVKALADGEALELALIENLQREDLPVLDEAAGYRRLTEEFGKSHDDVASLVGRSRSHVANTLRLLGLPDELKAMLADGRLSAGHARALLTAVDPVGLAQVVVGQGLNVRATERLAADEAPRVPPPPPAPAAEPDPDGARIAEWLALPVTLKRGRRGGSLTVRFKTEAEYQGLVQRLRPPTFAIAGPRPEPWTTEEAENH